MNTALSSSAGWPAYLRRLNRVFRRWAAPLLVPLAFVLFCTLSGTIPLRAANKKPAEFTVAIRNQDQGNWADSIEPLRRALQKQSEDGERIRLYGTRYVSY